MNETSMINNTRMEKSVAKEPAGTRAAPDREYRTDFQRGDAYTLYLREVGQVPLLSPGEEAELARGVRRGDEEARERMIKSNLRLVVKIARDYENLGLPLLDLINEGNIGLIKAVERYDPDKGAKLSTYSSWWIKQHIRRALCNQGKTIRMPVNAVSQMQQVRRTVAKLEEKFGRKPTDAEVASKVNLSERRVSILRESGYRPASLDAPLSDERSESLGEVVADDTAIDPSEHHEAQEAIGKVLDLIDELPERESKILRLRFGLDNGVEQTLESIGNAMGVTRERIRQIQNGALVKLREMLENPDAVPVAA